VESRVEGQEVGGGGGGEEEWSEKTGQTVFS
jgi:hypothetical protein